MISGVSMIIFVIFAAVVANLRWTYRRAYLFFLTGKIRLGSRFLHV